MADHGRGIRLKPRLKAAVRLGGTGRISADIGCDHGRLAAALIQQGCFERVIATDISEGSLQKCRALLRLIHLEERIDTRLGDGISVLKPGEADVLFLLGMGPVLMQRILSEAPIPLMGAKRVVFSPMHSSDEIRAYLYRTGCSILADEIVLESGRYYQVFSASPPEIDDEPDRLPEGWPEEFYELGYRAFEHREPHFDALMQKRIAEYEKRLLTARDTVGERWLMEQLTKLRMVEKLRKEQG